MNISSNEDEAHTPLMANMGDDYYIMNDQVLYHSNLIPESSCWYNDSFVQVCSLLGTVVAQGSDVVHVPPISYFSQERGGVLSMDFMSSCPS